jgi:phosphoglycerate dehydrogenase-like enzyme
MFGLADLEHVLRSSDIVLVTLPLTRETRGLIGGRELAAVKRGAWVVNVSRGGIVQERPLFEALQQGSLGGAILDVFEQEPLAADSPFWTLPNVFITPHIASEFAGWPSAVARLFCANLRRFVGGEPLSNVVDSERGY